MMNFFITKFGIISLPHKSLNYVLQQRFRSYTRDTTPPKYPQPYNGYKATTLNFSEDSSPRERVLVGSRSTKARKP